MFLVQGSSHPGRKFWTECLAQELLGVTSPPERAGSVRGTEPRTRPQVEQQTAGTGARRQPEHRGLGVTSSWSHMSSSISFLYTVPHCPVPVLNSPKK